MAAIPNPIDIYVGKRVRLRRTMLGMSQDSLGKALGLTFQQVQKYERGTNRIGSSRLYHISHILEVSIAYFFDGAQGAGKATQPGDPAAQTPGDPRAKRETLELVRAFNRILDPAVRKRLLTVTKSMAKLSGS